MIWRMALLKVAVGIETGGEAVPKNCGADRGRLSRVRDQPDVGGPLPGTAHHVGAKSDPGDAHVLAEIVRIGRAHHGPVAGDSPEVEAGPTIPPEPELLELVVHEPGPVHRLDRGIHRPAEPAYPLG
jgi:hypothetical protein